MAIAKRAVLAATLALAAAAFAPQAARAQDHANICDLTTQFVRDPVNFMLDQEGDRTGRRNEFVARSPLAGHACLVTRRPGGVRRLTCTQRFPEEASARTAFTQTHAAAKACIDALDMPGLKWTASSQTGKGAGDLPRHDYFLGRNQRGIHLVQAELDRLGLAVQGSPAPQAVYEARFTLAITAPGPSRLPTGTRDTRVH